MDPTWAGGERGAEVIERFLDAAHDHLSPGGSILLVYSSETGLTGDRFGYDWEILGENEAVLRDDSIARDSAHLEADG